MSDVIQLFWLEPTDQAVTYLRRYAGVPKPKPKCPGKGYHDAQVEIGRGPAAKTEDGYMAAMPDMPEDDPRWPTKCDHCDFQFGAAGHYQHHQALLYRRADNGELMTLHDAPPGAMWDAWWMSSKWRGPDGIHLMVRTPGGDWHVDGRASNCKADPSVDHYCWPRVGDPRDPQGKPPLHVGGNGGVCQVGAGSIGINDYHGFLDHGFLRLRRA